MPTTLNFGVYEQPPVSPPKFALGGFVFDISAEQEGEPLDSLVFAQPVQLVIAYRDLDIVGLDENELTLLFFNEETHQWNSDGIVVVARDPVNNKITVQISHLTTFGLFDVQERTLLPFIMRQGE